MKQREFILFMALVSMMSALAIDMLLPAFSQMRPDFGLAEDSTRLSLTITLFFAGSAVGFLIYGPLSDAWGRKRVLASSLLLYAAAAVVCTFSTSLTLIFAARFAWGVAAGGPRILSQAIVRDRYAGTAMARVMTLIQAAFFLGPIFAPLIGKLLLEVGSWRWVMAFGVISAGGLLLWSTRLEESLSVDDRRSLEPRDVLTGFRLVAKNRTTVAYGLAVMFGFGAFYSFLASSELIFSSVYDRENLFVWFFVTISLLFTAVAMTSNQLLKRFDARRVGLGAGTWYVTMASLQLFVIALADGRPNFWLWATIFGLTNAGQIAFFPIANSLALEPMGALAGTATAALGFSAAAGGAILGNQIDRRIDDTIWALGIGYLIYASLSLLAQYLAAPSRRR